MSDSPVDALKRYEANVIASVDLNAEYPHDLKILKVRDSMDGDVLLSHYTPFPPLCDRLDCNNDGNDILRITHWIHRIGTWQFQLNLCDECCEVMKGEFKYYEEELKQGVEFKYEVP